MRPVITAFAQSPDRGRGLARDTRVRWALEEVGQPYDTRLLSFEQMARPDHLALNPFGQIPTYEEAGLALFDSSAIILHIARTRPGLLPADPAASARAVAWMFSAVSTLEQPILDRETAVLTEGDAPWYDARLPLLEARIDRRLAQLAAHLGDRDWLEAGFTAGDLVTVSVLQRLASSGLLGRHPRLAAYVARAEARPAFARAFAAQRAVFEAGRR